MNNIFRICLICLLTSGLVGQERDFSHTLWGGARDALRWYNTWVASIDGAGSVICGGSRFGAHAVMVCNSAVRIELLADDSDVFRVLLAVPAGSSADELSRHYSLVNAAKPVKLALEIPVREIKRYVTNRAISQRAFEVAHQIVASSWPANARATFQYPMIAASDPLYHVYRVVDGDVVGIFELRVRDGIVEGDIYRIIDREHDNMPLKYNDIARRPSAWYRVVRK